MKTKFHIKFVMTINAYFRIFLESQSANNFQGPQNYFLARINPEVQPDFTRDNVDGLVEDCSNSSGLAMELLQSCTKPSM